MTVKYCSNLFSVLGVPYSCSLSTNCIVGKKWIHSSEPKIVSGQAFPVCIYIYIILYYTVICSIFKDGTVAMFVNCCSTGRSLL